MKLATKVCKGLYFEFTSAKEVKFKVVSLVKFELCSIYPIRQTQKNLLQALNLPPTYAADDAFKAILREK